MNKKITKRENYETLATILATEALPNYDVAALKEFVEKEIENLDKKAIAAKARAAKQKEAGDALREEIKATLSTDEFKTIPQILKALGDDNLSSQKISPRLGQLVNLGVVERGDVKIGGEGEKTRTITGYRLIG